MKRLLLAGYVAAALAGCEGELWDTSHGSVDDGNEALRAGEAERALAAYDEAASELPESPALSYDRGLALSLLGEHEQATQMLLRALDADDPGLRYKVYAALGAAYARWALDIERSDPSELSPDDAGEEADEQGGVDPMEVALPRWERAVEHLEKALLLGPGDEDVLRNLEIALLRVDPPCAARNDDLEPNDVPEQAAPIEVRPKEAPPQSGGPAGPPPDAEDELTWERQLMACPEDVDWLSIELSPGDRLAAEIDVPSEAGRLGLSLFAPDGARRLRPPADADVTLQALEFTAGPDDGGTYLLRVDNIDRDEVSYGIEVTVRPPCEATEDRFEENDDPASAAVLTPGTLDGLRLCPLDEDWYEVTLAEGESLFVFASLQSGGDEEGDGDEEAPGPPPFELDLHGPDGTVSSGGPTGQGRVATLLTPGEGTYRIRVAGEADLEARYQMVVQIVPPCPEGNDALEPNDTPETASDFEAAAREAGGAGGAPGAAGGAQPPGGEGPPPPMLLRICPDDEDWLTVTAEPDQPTVVSAVFEHAKGDLVMSLYDEAGAEELHEADASSPDVNGESLALPEVEEPTPYTLRVRGRDGAENFYLFRLDQPQGDGGQDQDEQDQDEQDQDEDSRDEEQDGEQERDPEEPDGEQDRPRPEEQAQEESTPLEDALDKLDRNPDNLEARERARKSPLVNHPPDEDW